MEYFFAPMTDASKTYPVVLCLYLRNNASAVVLTVNKSINRPESTIGLTFYYVQAKQTFYYHLYSNCIPCFVCLQKNNVSYAILVNCFSSKSLRKEDIEWNNGEENVLTPDSKMMNRIIFYGDNENSYHRNTSLLQTPYKNAMLKRKNHQCNLSTMGSRRIILWAVFCFWVRL